MSSHKSVYCRQRIVQEINICFLVQRPIGSQVILIVIKFSSSFFLIYQEWGARNAYEDLARETRAFCPPERVIPLSPTRLLSLWGNRARSLWSALAWTTRRNSCSSYGFPSMMFWRIDPAKTQGSCPAYPNVPLTCSSPLSNGSSPKIAWTNELCPKRIC